MSDSEKPEIGRRRFLKSLFGLGAVTESQDSAAQAAPAKRAAESFFWTNLRNGHVGFPTGMNVPAGLPGSVMKLVSAAALRESGHYCGEEKIECRGTVTVHNHTYSCLYPHGFVDLTQAIGLSCNVFFALASQKISPATVLEFARKFGLDTPVDGRAAESFPHNPTVDTAQYALGLAPDLRPNALQLMRMAGLIGLKGTVPGLHDTGNFDAQKQPEPSFSMTLQPSTWMVLEQGMRICGRQGTAKKLDPEDTLKLAVKTGTAPHGKTFQSWIIGYFPFDKPLHAFCLRASSGTSQESAVPDAHKWLFSVQWS